MDLKNLSFGLMAFKMALKVHNGKWIGTSSEQPNLELGQNLDVLTKLDFWPLALKMALKVKSDHKFEFFGLCSLCEHGFISPKALYRLLVMFCSAETR